VQSVPASAVLEPGPVWLLGIHAGDTVVDRDEHRDGEDDRCCPEDSGDGDQAAGANSERTMFVGCSSDQQQGESIPKWHDPAQDLGEQRGRPCMGVVGSRRIWGCTNAATANSLPTIIPVTAAARMS
jgi:hypothetical protein